MVQCPSVVHHGVLYIGGVVTVVFVWYVLAHVLRRHSSFALDHLDPIRCDALVTKGSWLDNAHQNWQPEGEYMRSFVSSLLHCAL